MSLRARLVASFGLVIAVLLLPAVIAVDRLGELRSIAVEERGKHAAAAVAVGRFDAALTELDRYERSYVALGDPDLQTDVWRSLAKLRDEVEMLRSAGFAEAAEPAGAVVDALDVTARGLDALVAQGRMDEATSALAGIEPLMAEARRRLSETAEVIDRRAHADFARAEAISDAARTTTLIATLGCLLLALGLGLWTTRSLTSPIRRLAGSMAEVAEGSFEAPGDLPYDRWDEIGHLATSFRTMTRRLSELDRMKAEFVGMASHELKAPINVIQGYAELIEEELAEEVTAQQKEILHAIAEQTHVMTRLVSRLMDISRLEAGSYRMEPDEIHVEDLLTGVARAFDVVAGRKRQKLRTVVRRSARRRVVMDVDLIRDEVLGNLVSNALKFTPEGGEVRVVARGGPGTVSIEVSDTGPGIPPEHRPHVFGKYYQAERSRRIGAGLGLAIAREIVEAHGGTIELVDTPGPGATFRVTLPLRPMQRLPAPPEPADSRPERISTVS